MWAAFTLMVLVLVGTSARPPNVRQNGARGYIKSGDCEENRMCTYSYAATQELFQGQMQQNLTFTATVEISCDSVGTFNGILQATRYCMTVKDSMVNMEGVEEDVESSGAGEEPQTTQSADKLLSGWFCFIQTEEGKIVAIYHSKRDHPSAVNIKKSIAAAFQANFKGTDTEEEVDPQSIHTSHYRYESRKDGFMMHRTVNSKDVVDYSLHVPKDDVTLTKEEDIEYKSGKLYHSAGRTSVKLLSGPEVQKDTGRDSLLADVRPNPGERDRKRRETDEQDGSETYDGSTRLNMFSAEGTYTLDLTYCYSVPRVASRHRRTVEEGMKNEFVESTLMAQLNQAFEDMHVMADLRQKVPSVPEALVALHQNLDNTKLADKLQLLLELESKHGPLKGFKPALDDVLSYLEKLQQSDSRDDIRMRTVIYSLLGPEGSLASQKALLHALETVTDEKERNSLSLYVALTTNPHPMFISRIQEILHSNVQSTDSLLLAYGALASKVSPEVQQQAVKFLLNKLNSVQENSDSLVHLIHSLGNSASDLTLDPLLEYAASDNLEVQLAAIYALRKHTNNVMVQEAFIAILRKPSVQEDQIATITQTLNAGLEHIKSSGSTKHNNPELTIALVSATMEVSNPELHNFVARYLLNLKTEEGAKYAQALQSKYTETSAHGNNTRTRVRRGTDWDESNSVYDCVDSQSSRANDVNTYPSHRAYLYGKKFGLDDLNVQFAAGGFAGVSPVNVNYKMFGRAVAKGYAFGTSATGLDVQILNEKQDNNIRLKLYVNVAGQVLVNVDESIDISYCITRNWPLYDSPRYTLLSFSHSVFIYVGLLSFSITVTAEMNVDAEAELCIGIPADASATLRPSLTLRAEGSASASLAEIVRGGISIGASFTYQVEPEATTHLCLYGGSVKSQNCMKLYDSWPSNYAEIYAWYQTRSIRWCPGIWGIDYPCGFDWGSQHRWNDLSNRWDLGSRGRQLISGICDATTPC